MALVGVVLLALVVTIPPMIESLLFVAKQGQPGTRQLAKDWILQHRDGNGPYLAMELYTPSLPRAKQIRLRRGDPAFANLSPEQQHKRNQERLQHRHIIEGTVDKPERSDRSENS